MRERLDVEREQLITKERELMVNIERQSGETKVSMEKVKNLKAENARLTQQIENINNQIAEQTERAQKITAEKAEMQSQYESLTADFNKLNEEIAVVLESISKIQTLNDEKQSQIMDILDDLTESRSQDANIRGELNTLIVRLGQIEKETVAINAKIKDYTENKLSLQKEWDTLAGEKEKLTEEQKKAQKAVSDGEIKLIELNRKLTKLNENIAVDSDRKSVV